jgi:hypothetical protein
LANGAINERVLLLSEALLSLEGGTVLLTRRQFFAANFGREICGIAAPLPCRLPRLARLMALALRL